MGRQINFYMSKSVEDKFIEFLSKCEFSNLYDKHETLTTECFIDEWNEKWMVFLHKEEYGKLIKRSGLYCNMIYATINPVIEFMRSWIDDNEKGIHGGRLWIPSEYQLQSCDDFALFTKDYNMLVRWIKKHVPYREVKEIHPLTDEVFFRKEYISNELMPLLEQGYTLV